MSEEINLREYRKNKTQKLFEAYKDLIEKTFEVVDKDLLQEQIDGEDEKATEQRFLDSIKKRRVSLDEVDIMLDKIEKLEKVLKDGEENEDGTPTVTNFAKERAARNQIDPK